MTRRPPRHRSFRLTPTDGSDGFLSSTATSSIKFLARCWLGLFGVVLAANIVHLSWSGQFELADLVGILGPTMMLAFGYFVFRQQVFDFADEVFDEGDSLLVRKGRLEERILLSNIVIVYYGGMHSPQRITLTLQEPCRFGTKISFFPHYRLFSFATHPIAEMLIERARNARLQVKGS